jgi:hypothetical protein
MRVKKWELRSESFSTFMSRSNENKSCMRVEKREFAREFSQLSCPGQTRTRVARELMRVEKREFAREFSQLSCPGQKKTRVTWHWIFNTVRLAKTLIKIWTSSKLTRVSESANSAVSTIFHPANHPSNFLKLFLFGFLLLIWLRLQLGLRLGVRVGVGSGLVPSSEKVSLLDG